MAFLQDFFVDFEECEHLEELKASITKYFIFVVIYNYNKINNRILTGKELPGTDEFQCKLYNYYKKNKKVK